MNENTANTRSVCKKVLFASNAITLKTHFAFITLSIQSHVYQLAFSFY